LLGTLLFDFLLMHGHMLRGQPMLRPLLAIVAIAAILMVGASAAL
jgi:hypothetical protein